jgi:hypothetical protein
MLPRPSACCRAVKRQLFPPSDSIWVSDELLRNAFQRFIVSRTGRRHGSFVPGPLESRRRLGKRRITHLTDHTPASASNIGPLWGLFGEVDNTQWQWEAPTTQKSRGASDATLPAWLADWTTLPKAAPPLSMEESTSKPIEEINSVEEDIFNFRKTLQTASLHQMIEICDDFNARFKQSLRLGLVSESEIRNALETVSHDLCLAFSKSGLTDTRCLLSFYQAFWEGLVTCKVFQPVDLDAEIMGQFLFRLGKLPICMDIQALIHDVIRTVSVTQLSRMYKSLVYLVPAWAQTWLHEQLPSDTGHSIIATRGALLNSSIKLDRLVQLLQRKDNRLDLSKIQEAFGEAKESIDNVLENIVQAEKVLMPSRVSIDTLACVLGHLPQDLLSRVLHSCTHRIISIHKRMESPSAGLCQNWVSLVAKIPELSDQVFVGILKRMEEYKEAAQYTISADVLLSRWVCQGYIKQGALIRVTAELCASDPHAPDLGSLLFAIHIHRDGQSFPRLKDVSKLLHALGRHREIYRILTRMKNLGITLPGSSIGPIIAIMSKYDVKLAYRLYKLFYSGLRASGEVLHLKLIPNFVVSMVGLRHPWPPRIWGMLDIPFYEQLQPSERSKISKRPLPPAEIELMTKLAIAFAQADTLPRRVAFRNVLQCLHHLRQHNAPVSSQVTRAISHAGFTRKILAGQWISKELLSWALSLIEVAEGTEVAMVAEKAVTYWNERLEAEQQSVARKKAREMNVLRVGPID